MLDTPLSNGTTEILQLRDEDLFPATLDPKTIPVIIERPGHHKDPLGGNVLYADGHVEYIEYPGKYPMTEAVISALESFDEPRESGTP